jgi:SH3-like domain-containing protein
MAMHRLALAALLLLASATSQAFDYRSVGVNALILYDSPSIKGAKLFVAPRGMPLEIVLRYGDWVKVRDVNGDLAWVPASTLSAKRTVVVRSAMAKVRAGPDDSAEILMTADKGVLLELVDPQATSWVKVRHKEGIAGYVRAADVWGI